MTCNLLNCFPSNWKFGEPSNTGGEDCVEVWIDLPLYRGQWNDKSCDANNNFICKKSKGLYAYSSKPF